MCNELEIYKKQLNSYKNLKLSEKEFTYIKNLKIREFEIRIYRHKEFCLECNREVNRKS